MLDQAVAKHWDKKLTVRQNYQKLGLALSGDKISNTPKMVKMPELEEGWTELSPEELSEKLGPDYAVVERNEEGEIIDILMGAEPKQPAPAKKQTPLVKELSQKAQQVKLVGRHLSRGEIAWIEALIAKHGDDYEVLLPSSLYLTNYEERPCFVMQSSTSINRLWDNCAVNAKNIFSYSPLTTFFLFSIRFNGRIA